MLVLSYYQKLNEERSEIISAALESVRFHDKNQKNGSSEREQREFPASVFL